MKTTVGLWIDHRKAMIVVLSDQAEETKTILSDVDKQPGRSDGLRSNVPYEAHKVPPDNTRERKFTGQLQTYYDEVISVIRDAESILILGPGEAKGEFKKRLEKEGLAGRIAGVETADDMTDRQVAAKAREYFQK